jgi:hypothetical protein
VIRQAPRAELLQEVRRLEAGMEPPAAEVGKVAS